MGRGRETRVSCLPNLSLLAFCCCDKGHELKQLVEDRAYSSRTSGSQCITERNQGRNSRHNLEAETIDKGYLLVHSQADFQLLSSTAQNHLSMDGTTQSSYIN